MNRRVWRHLWLVVALLASPVAIPARASLAREVPVAEVPGERMLVVLAHPDDELFLAGTLASAADAAKDVLVLYTTSGEAGTDGSGRGLIGAALGRAREGEASASLRALGIRRKPVFLRTADRKSMAHLFKVAARVRRLVEAFQPGTVVTFGPDGLTGHRDHVAAYVATLVAVERTVRRPLLFSMAASEARALAWKPLWRLNCVAGEHVALRVDVRRAAERRALAASAHRTQLSAKRLQLFQRSVVVADVVEEYTEHRL